jgi:predicted Fe-Mo cluster-binding NifX family protein
MHFGHCEQFALLEVDREKGTILQKTLHQAPPHEPGALPAWLRELGADVIIAGGMGSRAQQLFGQSGIQVIVGAPSDSAEDLAAAYLAGTLETGANVCDH